MLLSEPIDIDNKELVLHHRQKLIVKKLFKISAEEIAPIITQLVVEYGNGCMTEHLSQTHHQCLTMERDVQLCLYFEYALEKASETKVMKAFTKSSSDMEVHELIKYNANDWKTIFCVEHRQALKHETFQLL
jgi:16S rRNA A1518/A1519 N6-dimethyltransferase RsmA/KsgA/DIM1 with predicted DNA glycosylase/AP lyase activity